MTDDMAARLEKFMEGARNHKARKHHVVPNSYIGRWSGPGGMIQITDMLLGQTRPVSPLNAARITDYYRVESPELDAHEFPPALVETLLGTIEGKAVPALDALIQKGADGLTDMERLHIAQFMGFQYVRGQRSRNLVKTAAESYVRLLHEDLSPDGVRDLLARNGQEPSQEDLDAFATYQTMLREGKITVSPQPAALVGMPLGLAENVGQMLYEKTWALFRTRPILMTSDEPVISIGGPGRDRQIEAGLGTAPVVIFPVAPDALLVMFTEAPEPRKLQELTLIELAELNREIAASASRWVIDQKGRKAAQAFDIPPSPNSSLDLREYPGTNVEAQGDIIRTTRPNRWAQTTTPPDWPVLRWFN
ncbi:DUF4238 domain-containing protein [Arthrobacter sp. YAF34]|uniref:DUF4238 domain-containing protein n=1 Tax=Arthrobacter sp. YAF34 TaxID=3233083 RepID=UPI003F8E5426